MAWFFSPLKVLACFLEKMKFISFFKCHSQSLCWISTGNMKWSEFSSVIFFRVIIRSNDDSVGEFTPGKRLLSFGAIGTRRKFYKDFSNSRHVHSFNRTRHLEAPNGAWMGILRLVSTVCTFLGTVEPRYNGPGSNRNQPITDAIPKILESLSFLYWQ